MANYIGQFLKATSNTTVGVASLECPSSGQRRIKIYDMWMGSDAGTLGTSDFRFELNGSTTASTGTSFTPRPLDKADAACAALFKSNLTVQGTNTAGDILATIPLSEQATARWICNPGDEIVIPNTASAGVHLNTPVTGNTPSIAGAIYFRE
jgi:hypothetical protein